MSLDLSMMKTNGVTGEEASSAIGRREPLAHPCNCNNECPYGYNRAFCFPCMKKIVEEYRTAKKSNAEKERIV